MIFKPTGSEFILPVRQFVQLDNSGEEGYRECFLTSSAMLVNYLLDGKLEQIAKEKGLKEPEDAYALALARFGDTTDWNAQLKTLESFGIKGYASKTASLDDVAHSLYNGIPVIIGTQYKGSGHIVLVVGRNGGGFTVLCPNGIRNGATNNWVARFASGSQAKPDQFSWSLLEKVFTDLGPEKGWALFITEVNGELTGVKSGM
jgi:hypothetical protein